MPFTDKPTPEFLAKLEAFEPEYAAAACIKEVSQLLLILADAPVFVCNCMDGFLKGTYRDRMFTQSVIHFVDSASTSESQSS